MIPRKSLIKTEKNFKIFTKSYRPMNTRGALGSRIGIYLMCEKWGFCTIITRERDKWKEKVRSNGATVQIIIWSNCINFN